MGEFERNATRLTNFWQFLSPPTSSRWIHSSRNVKNASDKRAQPRPTLSLRSSSKSRGGAIKSVSKPSFLVRPAASGFARPSTGGHCALHTEWPQLACAHCISCKHTCRSIYTGRIHVRLGQGQPAADREREVQVVTCTSRAGHWPRNVTS